MELVRRHARGSEPAARRVRFQRRVALALLCVNFPVSAFYAYSAIVVFTRYTLVVVNDSDQPVESFVVTGPDVDIELGPIPAGGRTQRHLRFGGDGKLAFEMTQQQSRFGGELEGYVTPNFRSRKTVKIKQGGFIRSEGGDVPPRE